MKYNISEKEALKKLEYICSNQEICAEEAKKKLYKYDLTFVEIESIINNLKENNFINHQRFSRAFINDKIKFNKWGKIKISYFLRSKKIENTIIEQEITEFDDDIYIKIIKEEIIKKIKTIKSKEIDLIKPKIIRFAESRGYEYENYKSLINEI